MQSTPLKASFPPVVDRHVRVLICGSLPGDRSLAARQYYAHPQNQFWRLISAVIGRDLVTLTYPERLAALLGAYVGLWDVVATAQRRGSTDAALVSISPNDIAALAATLPDLRAIAFNGGTALRHGLRQLGAAAGHHAIVALPSSSPLHTIGFEAKLPAWLGLRMHLDD
ncbi:DNA-deoxyinosine glycosylase [Sphingomonas sp. BT-65]|uniref:DNA-deoxyinosine glycosylase n=1 Tax=Sphingomonas sp. BT-65 TaxID=2989821 RepID=UPI0022367423|nr:DNA-deoxyinosine glycosylase [Sphingomonas sp. BT-65]MCW4463094.1 DNA-deoxyinosine glycosylase [Sphingomonas sp. BT-65]